MLKKNRFAHTDLVIISDNNLGLLGGERESQLILINEIKNHLSVSVIQPGAFEDSIDGVNVYWKTKSKRMKQLIKNPFAFIAYFFKINRLIGKIKPSVIHSNSQVSFFIVTLGKRLKLIPKNCVIIHTDRGLFTKCSAFFRRLFYFSFKKTDVLVTTTTFNQKKWIEANEKKKLKLRYEVIGNTAGLIYETIDETKMPNNTYLTVGFAGRMCDWKDWPLAENICKKISSIGDVHIKMYVSCLDKHSVKLTNEMFERMLAIFDNRFEGRINVPFSEMEDFYYQIDVFVLTSKPNTESFGRTIVEAMSRKTAVLTTDAGGSVEVVSDKDTVCNTSLDFANKIIGWNNDKSSLFLAKEKNLQRVRKEYTYSANVENYLKLYRCYIKNDE